jgi:hypothetical protein
MNETRVHVVITDVRKSDRLHASSVIDRLFATKLERADTKEAFDLPATALSLYSTVVFICRLESVESLAAEIKPLRRYVIRITAEIWRQKNRRGLFFIEIGYHHAATAVRRANRTTGWPQRDGPLLGVRVKAVSALRSATALHMGDCSISRVLRHCLQRERCAGLALMRVVRK